MSSKRYPEELKRGAVRQLTARGHNTAQAADRLSDSPRSLHAWIKKHGPLADGHKASRRDRLLLVGCRFQILL